MHCRVQGAVAIKDIPLKPILHSYLISQWFDHFEILHSDLEFKIDDTEKYIPNIFDEDDILRDALDYSSPSWIPTVPRSSLKGHLSATMVL